MTTRCQALLGTFVEISIDQDEYLSAIDKAFATIKQIQDLMSFHNPLSELNAINQRSHLTEIAIHPWTAQILHIAQEIYTQSNGLFNCGIGHRLVAVGLLPQHLDLTQYQFGGIEDINFITPKLISSSKPLCLDLGGIAKGFAVDRAVEVLRLNGVESGCVNAGGDLRVFGGSSRPVHIRNPKSPGHLIEIGSIHNAAIATSSLYFSKRDRKHSHIINPLAKSESDIHADFSESFSIVTDQCVYADALTKVFALAKNHDHPCFKHFSAQAVRIKA
jgi:FAD:protein FMN transferase